MDGSYKRKEKKWLIGEKSTRGKGKGRNERGQEPIDTTLPKAVVQVSSIAQRM